MNDNRLVTVQVYGKERQIQAKGAGKYELHYIRIHGWWLGDFSQLEICCDLHKTKLGLHWNAICKGMSPSSIKVLGWRISKEAV